MNSSSTGSKTGKKLQGNGLYESSRMMLPEHKEAYLRHQRELNRRAHPSLEDEERQRIGSLLAQAKTTGRMLTLTVYGPFEDEEITGIVRRIDPLKQEIHLEVPGNVRRLAFDDILRISD
ncbi:YolD-like family protein [Paenibacillus chitinolyticus]|uniref:YolD-like family protein n=1 Tax=Paenibacillus chitinolyticus TaxID=79263 RepID=UPI00365D0D81